MDGTLMALIGPNEAGKSSFLRALQALQEDQPFSAGDGTRDLEEPIPRVEATFELDDDDRAAIRDITGGDQVRQCTLIRRQSAPLEMRVEPRPPHDLQPRQQLAPRIAALRENGVLQTAHKARDQAYSHDLLTQLHHWLTSTVDPLPQQFFQIANKIQNTIRQAAQKISAHPPVSDEIETFVQQLHTLVSHEKDVPGEHCASRLLERRPHFLLFDDKQRYLESRYDLATAANDTPPPLRNLAALARIDLAKLYRLVQADRDPKVTQACERASQRLAAVFANSWVRADVVPVLRVNDQELRIFVRTTGGEDLSWFDERSDGFRWFAALVAFLLGQPQSSALPVLLIDEAETHLSYDAQANLTATLADQELAQLVVYTTHSAGCLPPDLGTGIRTVIPQKDKELSTVRNGFWHSGPGYTPLLMAMGASALAFTPARRVVVGEGPSECILLPSLLREATETKLLSFQVAPGLSNVSATGVRDLRSIGGEVAYLVDGDRGGRMLRKYLISIGFPEERIVSYEDVGKPQITLEDLVAPGTFIKAVHQELKRWQGSGLRIRTKDVPNTQRMSWLNDWCSSHGLEPVSKLTLAQRIVDLRGPSVRLVDPRRRNLLRRLQDRLEHVLDPLEKPNGL